MSAYLHSPNEELYRCKQPIQARIVLSYFPFSGCSRCDEVRNGFCDGVDRLLETLGVLFEKQEPKSLEG